MQTTLSDTEYFDTFNFHPSEIQSQIHQWLEDETGKPLVLAGEAGMGRRYVLQAAIPHQRYNQRPFQLVTFEPEILSEDSEKVISYIEKTSRLNQKNARQWHQFIQEMTETLDVNSPDIHGFNVVLKLAAIPALFKSIQAFFAEHKNTLPESSARDLIQTALEHITQSTNLILHLENLESDFHTVAFWQAIAQDLDILIVTLFSF
jgi:hypothetical protein